MNEGDKILLHCAGDTKQISVRIKDCKHDRVAKKRRKSWPHSVEEEGEERNEKFDLSEAKKNKDSSGIRKFSYTVRTSDQVVSSADSGLMLDLPEHLPGPANQKLPELRNPSQDLPSHTGSSQGKAKNRKIASIFQHYYPEGDWGYVILACSILVQILVQGLPYSFGIWVFFIQKRFQVDDFAQIAWLGGLGVSMPMIVSPLIVALCKSTSTRLTAVIGGLVASLGCLFTSFASQFHQIFISYGLIFGIGASMCNCATNLMLGQYFKKKRPVVEVIFVASTGIGIAASTSAYYFILSHFGWMLGLEVIAGICSLLFVCGMFYRSATLYHPQRRAILHLKSQKRKIKSKEKDKIRFQEENKPKVFDFYTLKSQTVRITFFSFGLSSFGLYMPLLYLCPHSLQLQNMGFEGFSARTATCINAILGVSWAVGCFVVGTLSTRHTKECHISKQYLCQACLFLCGFSMLAFPTLKGFNGYATFAFGYGFFLGGFFLSAKLFIFDKVRSRNFPHAWGFAQLSMSVPSLLGLPIVGYLKKHFGYHLGFYFAPFCVILGSLTMIFIDVHRSHMRKKKHKKKDIAGSQSQLVKNMFPIIQSKSSYMPENNSNSSSSQACCPDAAELLSHASFPNVFTPLHVDPVNPLISSQPVFTFNDLIGLKNELTDISGEVIDDDDDMDLPEPYFYDEMDFHEDHITSCNKVENCVMLSEYEQNLIKEKEDPISEPRRGKKHSLRDPMSFQVSGHPVAGIENNGVGDHSKAIPVFQNTAMWRSKYSMTSPKRSITTIDEASV